MSDPSAATFHKTAGGSVNESELITSGRDTTVQKSYNFSIAVFPDVIGFVQFAAQHFVAWTRSADGRERDPVDICDIVPPDPSSLPVSSIADRYTRSMLECLAGYPLYEPHPFSQLSKEYSHNGVNVGDVGFVRQDGAFDFLFNICPPQNTLINPPNLPDGFSLETPEQSEARPMRPLSCESCFHPRTVTITKSGEYICEGSEGAILELPDGAVQEEAIDIGQFAGLAKLHGVEWYKYTMNRGRNISNGSLYLVTSFTKCTHWGIAVFDRPCDPGQGLTFGGSPFCWKGSRSFPTKVADPNQGNQCVFLRGYKIMIRQDIFNELYTQQLGTRQRATRIRGGASGGTADFLSKMLSGGNPFTRTKTPTGKNPEKVVLHANFNSSPVHPSDLVNYALLNQNPNAKVALTHDDVWCDMLRKNFPQLNYATLMNIAQSYTSNIDEYGCVSLEKFSDSSNVLDESSRSVQAIETSAPQESIQDVSDERNPDDPMPAQASTTVRRQSVDHSPGDGDEGNPGISVLSHSRTSISIAPATVVREARNEGYHGNPIQTGMPLVTPEHPSIGHGVGAVQSRGTGHGVDPDLSIPQGAPTIATEQHSVECGDMIVQRGDALSTTFFQTSSNVETTSSNFDEVRGNTTPIRFCGKHGSSRSLDGQFTDVQRNLICDYIANLTVLPDIINNLRQHVLTQSIVSLPRSEAMFNDYQTKKKSGPCFEGTRVVLLREIANWATSTDESRMYVLSGPAGIGKSTVAYTIASRAADLNLLGASFFFSRDEAGCNNAQRFFTTIAYQLCVYNETFSKAIGDALLTERGSAAATKDPQDQLQALILDPLRSIVQSHARSIIVVVDALDECHEDDERGVVEGLSQLVQELPCFKVILTTRPQPHLDHFLYSQGGHKIFRLQDIEDKVVDGDIRLYLKRSLSPEAVQEHYPQRQWCASCEEIDSITRAAGRLFIIASTAVRYIFDKSASNPAAQIQKLLRAFARYVIPFQDLDHFYTVILRDVVPEDCDDDDVVSHYQSVVGTIIFVQHPLPVFTLAHLIGIDVEEIRAVLDKLQSVILLGIDDVPRIYHTLFPDYLMDQARCKDPRLQIDARIGHTQIVTRCFEIMDKYLKRNILGLGDPARFICMSNEDGLKEDGITEEQLQEKIPQQLRYACVYWANHLEIADIEDEALMNGLEKFVDEHMMHWFEVLSLIGKLDLAHHAIVVVLTLLRSTFSDLHQLLSDALRFISKFYQIIKRSALNTYYSALSFTPTDSLLYRRYNQEAVYVIGGIEGGPEKWDALVANLLDGFDYCSWLRFLPTGTRLAYLSENNIKLLDGTSGRSIANLRCGSSDKSGFSRGITSVSTDDTDDSMTLWNSKSGRLIAAVRNFGQDLLATSSLFTVILWSENHDHLVQIKVLKPTGFPQDNTLAITTVFDVKLYDIKTHSYIFTTSSSRLPRTFSPDCTPLAVGDYDDSVKLWNIQDIDASSPPLKGNGTAVTALTLSRDYSQLACGFWDGTVELWKTSPTKRRITPMALHSKKEGIFFRILHKSHAKSVRALGFNPDGKLFASGSGDGTIKLWNGGDEALCGTLKAPSRLQAVALSNSMLVAGWDGGITMWNLDTLCSIHNLRYKM